MPNSQAPPSLSATRLWIYGLALSALWGLILVAFAQRSAGAAVVVLDAESRRQRPSG
jgi:hypothetical protein